MERTARTKLGVLGGILAAWSVCAAAVGVCYDITVTSSFYIGCTSCSMCFPPVYDIVPGHQCLAPSSQFPREINCYPATVVPLAGGGCFCTTPNYFAPPTTFLNGKIVCDMECPNGGEPGEGDS